MTIVEAIREVLQNHAEGLAVKEIYHAIIERDLFRFGAQDPVSVVRIQIRRHCKGLEFPTASGRKYFRIVRTENRTIYYGLLSCNDEETITEDRVNNSLDMLPEERIISAYQEHIKLMKLQLIDQILANDATFFEKMVVDLLLKMGYGYDKSSGIVTGRPHDGGIDGIIQEDKLGLDSIYIQAKRYNAQNTVKGPEIQQFIGAMGKVSKGVFITTSSFTKSAVRNAKDALKTIRLIDGDRLAELMLMHGVGVDVKQSIRLYQIDEDYFE